MGNCLVTKLKGSVENEFLPPYDSMTIDVLPHSGMAKLSIICPNAVLKLVGNAEIWDTDDNISLGKVTTLGSSETHYYHLGFPACDSACKLFISPKYGRTLPGFRLDDDTYIDAFSFSVDDFHYFTNKITFYGQVSAYTFANNVYGNIESLANIQKIRIISDNLEGNVNTLLNNYEDKSALTEFYLNGKNLEGTLDGFDWSRFTGFTTWFGFSSPKITGTFSSLATMPNLERIRLVIAMPLITGSVEDFVAIAKTRGAGSIRAFRMKSCLPNITYHGVAISINDDVPEDPRFSWDAQGNITCTPIN